MKLQNVNELWILKQKPKTISMLVLKTQGGRNQYIIYCMPLRISKTTLITCLAKTGQDQHLKLSPQCHILFYKVFFDKKYGKHQAKYLWQKVPPGINENGGVILCLMLCFPLPKILTITFALKTKYHFLICQQTANCHVDRKSD